MRPHEHGTSTLPTPLAGPSIILRIIRAASRPILTASCRSIHQTLSIRADNYQDRRRLANVLNPYENSTEIHARNPPAKAIPMHLDLHVKPRQGSYKSEV